MSTLLLIPILMPASLILIWMVAVRRLRTGTLRARLVHAIAVEADSGTRSLLQDCLDELDHI